MIENLFRDIPSDLNKEVLTELARSDTVKIERIVSSGHSSPDGFWYDQDQDEWVMVMQGAARIEFDDGKDVVSMSVGDHLLIPAHQKHRVAWTTPDEPTIWLAVHF